MASTLQLDAEESPLPALRPTQLSPQEVLRLRREDCTQSTVFSYGLRHNRKRFPGSLKRALLRSP